MQPINVSVGPLAAASANVVALSQTPASAITLNGADASGGVATLDAPRRVLVTTTGNESGKTILLVGTDRGGVAQSETLAAPNVGTVQSALDYKTVTAMTISAAAAGALTVGTSAVASSRWARLDSWAFAQSTIQCVASGTVSYTVETCMQDPNSATVPVAPSAMVWSPSTDPNVVNATGTEPSFFANSPTWARVTLNSGTGSVAAVIAQSGNVPL